MANIFIPPLLHILAYFVPLMDRDRQILEAVALLGYGLFIIFEMTKSVWPPLVQALMVLGALILRHLHRKEMDRRQQSLPEFVDLDLEQGNEDQHERISDELR
ncbi:hypothetical protein CJU90_0899 [Yarrowia sp. C11]|nr:hypothetical protein CKK34_2311 [Yarrowia sp. E02]KAG5373215.1 hypothetical protein CJU90_0899 [Yarrowia sp. C11]